MSKTANKRPTHSAFTVDGDGDNARWTEIGAAWQHADQQGFNIQLVPGIAVSGRLVLRPVKAKAEGNNGGQQ